MSDNKKYYYIKLKANYFDQDNIKLLEAMPNGYIFSLIIIKLYLKACNYDGCLMMTDRIPYDINRVDVLAKIINHDVSHVKDAIAAAINLDLITIVDSTQIWMTEIQNYIGQSSTEGDRKRAYRNKIGTNVQTFKDKCPKRTNVRTFVHTNKDKCPDKYPPEIEIEIKKKREKEKKCQKGQMSHNTYHKHNYENIQTYINTWNNLKLPEFRKLPLNISNNTEILNELKYYTPAEIIKAISNYSNIRSDTQKYRLFPVYSTFYGFLQSGVEKYADTAQPFQRCQINEFENIEPEDDKEEIEIPF